MSSQALTPGRPRCLGPPRRPPQASSSGEASVNSVHLYPQNVDHIVVCTRSPTLYLMTLQGQVGAGPLRGTVGGGDACRGAGAA